MPRLLLHLGRRHVVVETHDLMLGVDGPVAVHDPDDWRVVDADGVPISLLDDVLHLVDTSAWRCPADADELREIRIALQARRDLVQPAFRPTWWPPVGGAA
jgi:hypothetical protein